MVVEDMALHANEGESAVAPESTEANILGDYR
jgi:hypothetical protein